MSINRDKKNLLKINDEEEEAISTIRSVNDLGDEDFKLLKTLSIGAGERYVHLKVLLLVKIFKKICFFFILLRFPSLESQESVSSVTELKVTTPSIEKFSLKGSLA